MSSSDIDTVVLDIDGVIMDVSDSYRKAILETLELECGDSLSSEAVQKLKNVGGFNNDWNVTYALAFFVFGRDEGLEMDVDEWIRQIDQRGGGINSAKSIIDEAMDTIPLGNTYERWDPDRLRETFQQLYLGSELYQRIEDKNPRLDTDGYILSEPILIEETTVEFLQDSYHLGILTGRPSIEAKIALRRANVELPSDHVFTMDDWPGEKPQPGGLVSLVDNLGGDGVVYVGDTLDDIRTALNARERSDLTTVLGLGVMTGGLEGEKGRKLFEDAGATDVLGNINELPDWLRAKGN